MTTHKYNLKRNTTLTGWRFLPSQLGLLGERPASVDLRSMLPPVFDQGEEGSCGPNSASGLMCFFNQDVSAFSRQQIYYCVRELEGSVNEDAGVQTKDLFVVLKKTGAAPETLWPYTDNMIVHPTDEVLQAAAQYKIQSYSQLVSEEDFLECLAEGFPFILGFEVYSSFESNQVERYGVLPRPVLNREKDLGGHDVLVVGYDTNFWQNSDFLKSGLSQSQIGNTALLIRNSWGANWGIDGYFWMSIDQASSVRTGGDAWTGRV